MPAAPAPSNHRLRLAQQGRTISSSVPAVPQRPQAGGVRPVDHRTERRLGLPYTLAVCPVCERDTISRILLAGTDVFYRCTICGHVWAHPRRRRDD